MAKGYLSIGDDPVAGPAAILGLLSTGLGLLTERRPGPVLQRGLGQIGNAILFHGEQQAAAQAEAEKQARREAAYRRFSNIAQPQQPLGVGGPGAVAAQPGLAPQGAALRTEDLYEMMALGADAPELAKFAAQQLAEQLKPAKKTLLQQGLEAAGYQVGTPEYQAKIRQGVDYQFNFAPTPEEVAATELAQQRLAQQRASLAERQSYHQQRLAQGANGITVGTDANGRPIVQIGGSPGAGARLGTPAVNELEKKSIELTETAARLNEIDRTADPSLLTYGSKIKQALVEQKSKLGAKLAPDELDLVQRATDMRQAAMTNLNVTINDLTGAAMTAAEVPRIQATVPSMDDAPDVFPQKLRNATRLVRNAIIRSQMMRATGVDPLNSGIDIADTKKLMQMREAQLKATGIPDKDIEKKLREEFGY